MTTLPTPTPLLPTEHNDWLGYWGKHMKAQGFKAIKEYQKVKFLLPLLPLHKSILPYSFVTPHCPWQEVDSTYNLSIPHKNIPLEILQSIC